MAGQFGHQAAGVFVVQAPVDAALEFRRGHFPPPVVVAVPVVADAHDLADRPVVHEFHRLHVLGVVQPLLADHEDAVPFLPGAVHGAQLLGRMGHRLLTEGVLPGGQGVDGHLRVHGERRADDDALHFLVLQELPVIRIPLGRRAQGRCRIQVRREVVTQGDDLRRRILEQVHQVELAPGAGADDAQAGFLPRRFLLPLARAGGQPGEQGQRGPAEGEAGQEVLACHFLTHIVRIRACPSVRHRTSQAR